MRNISANAMAQITTARGGEPLIVVECIWDGAHSWFYCDRGAFFDLPQLEGKILELGHLEDVVSISGSSSSQSITIKLDDIDQTIKNLYNVIDFHFKLVNVYQWFTELSFDDKFIIFEGYVNTPIAWSEKDRTLSFEVISKVEDQEIGFSAEEGDFPTLPDDLIGKAWPLPFGSPLKVPSLRFDIVSSAIIMDSFGVHDPAPVSYTHLDVYKRQAPGSAEALWDSLNGGATTPRGATAPSPSRMDADGNIGPQASAGGSSDTASASPGHGGGIAGMIATAMDGLATGAVGHATASHHPTAPAFAPGPAVGVSASGGSGSRGSGSLGTGSGPFGAGGPQNSIAGNGSEFGPAVNSSNLYQSNLATAQRMLQYSPGRDTENSQDAITAVARMFGVKPEDLYIPKAPNILKPNADGTYTLPSPGGGSTTVGGGVLTVNSPGVGDRSNIFNGSVPNEDEEGFASGGLIGNAFSAMGPDNVRINARVGEFVMNPDSSRQFYSQLVSMNRGDSPRGGGYATGGTVNNSIGHMNINVNGADSPDKTARAVYSRIRREQRRGNI